MGHQNDAPAQIDRLQKVKADGGGCGSCVSLAKIDENFFLRFQCLGLDHESGFWNDANSLRLVLLVEPCSLRSRITFDGSGTGIWGILKGRELGGV